MKSLHHKIAHHMGLHSLLTRYILRQLLFALLVATGGLTLLIWLMQSLHFISLVVEHGLSFPVFIGLTSLLTPSFITIILPVTTFVVQIFIYHRLTQDHELTVMKGCGLSRLQLARPGILSISCATIICALLSLWVVPYAYHQFRQHEFQLRGQVALFMLQEGTFTKISDKLTVYIHDRQRNGKLNRILIQDDRLEGEHATILAQSGRLIPSDESPKLVLHHGTRQSLDHKSGHLNILSFSEEAIALDQGKKVKRTTQDVIEIPTYTLFSKHHYPSQILKNKSLVEGWRRIITPLECLAFGLIGLTSLLSDKFLVSRRQYLKKIALSVLIVCSLLAGNILLQDLATRNTNLILFIVLITFAPTIICTHILRARDERM